MVRDFQSVIGSEAREQMLEAEGAAARHAGRLHRRRLERDGPVPSRSSTIPTVAMIGRRGGGRRHRRRGVHAASLDGGRPGVLHGNRTYLLQDDDGQILEAHSISAGLDYPGIGPEHAWLHDIGRVEYVAITDDEALEAFQLLQPARGHHPGARAGARAGRRSPKIAPTLPEDHLIVMNLCGRGDKDIFAVAEHLGVQAVSEASRPAASSARFAAAARREGRAGLVTFLTAGDPDPETSLALLAGLAGGRRRPDRDRHAVHRSDGRRPGDPGGGAARAEAPGMTLTPHAGDGARLPRARPRTTPIVLMGYYNPIYRYGAERFLRATPAPPGSTG